MAVTVSPTTPTESSTGVPAGGFSQWFRNIGDWIKSLSPAGASEYETDVINVAPGIDYKRTGKLVEVRINATGSYPIGPNIFAAGAIPLSVRPKGTNPRGVAYFGAGQAGSFYVDTATGDVGIVNQTGATRTLAQGRILYGLD